MLDDPTDFPEAEYGTTAMRRWCLANRVIFAANAPNTRLSYQPPRYKRHVIQVVDPIALQNNRNWLAVLVRVLKNDNISAQDLAQNWKTVPTHLDRVSNQSSDVLVAAIITHPGNQLVQPFSVQHPQNDGPTFYYKVGLEGTSEEVRHVHAHATRGLGSTFHAGQDWRQLGVGCVGLRLIGIQRGMVADEDISAGFHGTK